MSTFVHFIFKQMFATDSTGETTKSDIYQARGLNVFYSVDYRDLMSSDGFVILSALGMKFR